MSAHPVIANAILPSPAKSRNQGECMTITTSPIDDTADISGRSPAGPTDVRPILSRSADNTWERTKKIRSDLYHTLEALCVQRGLEALVLQSDSYVHPAWVKFESWTPSNDPGITARAAMTIHITAKPYHRFEWIYKMDWEKHGTSGTVDHVFRLGEPEIDGLLTFLTGPPSRGLRSRQVRRILHPVQLRERWYELWKPHNKVPTIRRDWMQVASLGLVLAGGLLVVLGTQGQSLLSDSTSTSTFQPGGVASESSPVTAALGETPAVTPVTSPTPSADEGASVQTATLGSTSAKLDDGRLYDMRTIHAEAGQQIVATMRSADFDTLLVLGDITNGTFRTLATNDDNPGESSNSRVEFVAPAAGDYVILFTSYDQAASGPYTYSIK